MQAMEWAAELWRSISLEPQNDYMVDSSLGLRAIFHDSIEAMFA